jgi:hypothetical protein
MAVGSSEVLTASYLEYPRSHSSIDGLFPRVPTVEAERRSYRRPMAGALVIEDEATRIGRTAARINW